MPVLERQGRCICLKIAKPVAPIALAGPLHHLRRDIYANDIAARSSALRSFGCQKPGATPYVQKGLAGLDVQPLQGAFPLSDNVGAKIDGLQPFGCCFIILHAHLVTGQFARSGNRLGRLQGTGPEKEGRLG